MPPCPEGSDLACELGWRRSAGVLDSEGDLFPTRSVHQTLGVILERAGLVGWLASCLLTCSAVATPPAASRGGIDPRASEQGIVAETKARSADSETEGPGSVSSPKNSSRRETNQASRRGPLAPERARNCGEAKPNPHGFSSGPPAYPVPPVDGSCRVCELAPEPLPGCAPGEVGQRLTDQLTKRRGARVSVAATLSMTGTMCMGVGSQCRCASNCSSALALIPRGHTYESYAEAPLPPPRLALAWPQQADPEQQAFFERWPHHFDLDLIMHCTGDEGSLCCPIDFHRESWLEDVVVTGKISQFEDADGWTSPSIEVERICKPRATRGKSWQIPSGHTAPPLPDCTGTLSIETNVPVRLAVDHISRGKSPLRSLTVAAGTHEILFRHDDWGVVAPGTKVEVGCGENVHKKFELNQPWYLKQAREEEQARQAAFEAALDALPCTGKLHLTSEPMAVAVVDNRARGRTPQKSVRVPPGDHLVLFHHPDFEEETKNVEIACGQTRWIHMKLKKRRH